MSISMGSKNPSAENQRAASMMPIIAIFFAAIIAINAPAPEAAPEKAPRIPRADKFELLRTSDLEMQPDPTYEWIVVEDLGSVRVTVYGPDRNGMGGFPESNYVSRWFGRTREETGFTVAEALEWADELNLTGICAASPGINGLYWRHRDENPPIIEIDGLGYYLVVDRTAQSLWNVIDIWVSDPWPGGTYFAKYCQISEIVPAKAEME